MVAAASEERARVVKKALKKIDDGADDALEYVPRLQKVPAPEYVNKLDSAWAYHKSSISPMKFMMPVSFHVSELGCGLQKDVTFHFYR